jgi:hypothetical protein
VSWHSERQALIRQSELSPADRSIFRYLSGLAENATGQILPEHAWRASLARIAENTGHNLRTVTKSLAHLERHGYLSRSGSVGGRGKTTSRSSPRKDDDHDEQ